jgi:site-specific DNA-methyltransferase (adenine-specific)|tara:strand:+ start:2568 stop:3287 length:720 start_codon:yes stop_codon:yes gene_type:complete
MDVSQPKSKPGIAPKLNKIYTGNYIDITSDWPANCVDIAITSPPFNVGKNYGFKFSDKRMNYSNWLTTVGCELERLAKNAVYIFINQDNMWTVQKSLMGFHQWLFWHKPNSVAAGRNAKRFGWTRTIIPIAMSWPHNTMEMDKVPGATTFDLISAVGPQTNYNGDLKRLHIAQDPVDAYRPLIARTPGNIVFDPFMGSGTTAIASIRSGKEWIGCEINQEFVDTANKRIKDETKQVNLF